MGIAKKQVVLSLFPGADLFGKAFESRGFCVVRGPELLLGQDIRDFHAPASRFDGIIGGPPCTKFSVCRNQKRSPDAVDLIGEFVRIIDEAKPSWLVMENVPLARESPYIQKEWVPFRLRDYDCGGLTSRTRTFWFWPGSIIINTEFPGDRHDCLPAQHTLCASDGKRGKKGGWHERGYAGIGIRAAAKVQGFPEIGELLHKGREKGINKQLGVRYLGNGVPRAMGEWVADQVVRWLKSKGK